MGFWEMMMISSSMYKHEHAFYVCKQGHTIPKPKHHDEHLKPPQAITQTMRIKDKTAPPTISFICRLCSHIFLLSCLPCLWKLSAWNCKFSVLSTKSSIFSPLSRTCLNIINKIITNIIKKGANQSIARNTM